MLPDGRAARCSRRRAAILAKLRLFFLRDKGRAAIHPHIFHPAIAAATPTAMLPVA